MLKPARKGSLRSYSFIQLSLHIRNVTFKIMIVSGLLIGTGTILIGVYLWFQFIFNFWQRHNVPNVPGIFSGKFKDIICLKTNFSLEMKTIFLDPKFKNESVVGVYGYRPALLIRSHELIKRIFIRDFGCFRNRFSQSDPLHDPIGSRVMFFARNELWKKQRLQTSPVFRSDHLKNNMYPLLQKIGRNLEECLLRHNKQGIIEVKQLAGLFIVETLNATVFGIDSNALKHPDAPFVAEMKRVTQFNFKRSFHFSLIFFMPKLCSLFRAKTFYNDTEQFARSSMLSALAIRERSSIKHNDLVDVFVQLKREAEAKCADMSHFINDITSQALMLLFAGYESTSNTISHALYELAKNLEVQQILREELCQAWTEGSGVVTYESLRQLKYLDMVVNETLRMYPILAVLERAYTPAEKNMLYSLEPFCNFQMPNEMPVYISAFGLHYDPEVRQKFYSENQFQNM